MKKYGMMGLLLTVLLSMSSCAIGSDVPEKTTAVLTEGTTEVEETTVVSDETPEPTIDREAIMSKVYTIPRNNPYSTGVKTIGFDRNVLSNSDFISEQTPWQINSLDGVVIDKGLNISEQTAQVQHVILTQGVMGFEKMKTYQIELIAAVEGQVLVKVAVRSVEDYQLLAQVSFETNETTTNYIGEFPLNYEVLEGAVVEIDIETDKADVFILKDISLKRKPLEMVWSDEFDIDGLPDPEKWGYDVGGTGWGNGERQYYTASDIDNAFIRDGILTITALEEDLPSNPYSSARLVTLDKFSTKYKRIEVMAKLPDGIGTWPAIWMLPSARVYGSWPSSGEIDIMEHVGYDPDIIHGTIHTTTYNHMKNTQKAGLLHVPDSREAFHRYTIDWTAYEIDFYIDDYLYFTYDNDGSGPASWPYDKDFYLILCLAVGGGWGGQQGIDDTAFPATLEIDYVRYYELPVESLDIEAPETVKEITTDVTGTLATFHWSPSSDDYLVHHYEVYLDNALLAETENTSYTVYTLEESNSYSVGIVAVDGTGNQSDLITSGFMTSEQEAISIDFPIEGEDALINMGGQIKVGANTTYVEYLDDGDYLVFEVAIPKSANYSLSTGISSLMSKGAVSVAVDGETVLTAVELPSNGGWDNFEEVPLGMLSLSKGTHYITLLTEKSGYTVDYITIE